MRKAAGIADRGYTGPKTPGNRVGRSIWRPHGVHGIEYPVSILGVLDPVYISGAPGERIAPMAGDGRARRRRAALTLHAQIVVGTHLPDEFGEPSSPAPKPTRGTGEPTSSDQPLLRPRTEMVTVSGTVIGTVILVAVVSARCFSTGWVLRDARARGIPRRKALTWAALLWVEFPLFLWLYRRMRPKGRRRAREDNAAA